MSRRQSDRIRIFAIAAPAVVAAAILLGVSLEAFGSLVRPGILPEVFLVLYGSYLVSRAQRSRVVASLLSTSVVLIVYGASALKWIVFDEPLLLGDLASVDELWASLAWPWRAAGAAILAISAGAALVNLRAPSRRDAAAVCPLVLFAFWASAAPGSLLMAMDVVRPDVSWRPVSRMWRAGPFYSLARQIPESARLRRTLARIDASSAVAAHDALHLPPNPSNIHVVVMESFVDPRNFPRARFARDPIDPRFRRWMDQGFSLALSPTFGGQTARAEFELLCGVPSYGSFGAEFNLIDRDLPCLPRLLRAAGYRTWASVPVSPSFFRVGRAYPALGFEERFFADAFDVADRDGLWLSDESLLRQALGRLNERATPDSPLFNYVVAVGGHEPFSRDASRRPAVFAGETWLDRLANTVYYSSRAAADFIEAVERADPGAVIVVVGDHLPIFGTANREFERSRYEPTGAPGTPAEWTAESLATRATPLLVRRRSRSVALGIVPHYLLGEVLLGLIGDKERCRDAGCVRDMPVTYRPMGDEPAFTTRESFPARACVPPSEDARACAGAQALHDRLRTAYDRLLAAGIRY